MSTAFTKINGFVQDLAQKKHNLNADSFAACLSTTMTQSASTAFVPGTTDLATGDGYTQGGQSLATPTATQTSGTLTFATSTTPLVWTASSGGITFRYVLIVNTTANLIVGYYDYGSSLTINSGSQFTFTPGAAILTLA